MAKTVNGAFSYLMSDIVNLAKERTQKARDSRDAVIDKINGLTDFLKLDKSRHLYFGSFSRRTKIRPIDDIDIMICIDSTDLQLRNSDNIDIQIMVKNTANTEELKTCCDRLYGYYPIYILNSNRVKNKLKTALSGLHDCRKAELHSNQEAVTLEYSTYEWNFDIVPCIYISEYFGQGYYLIPNGKGNWKKTDPRRDRDKVTNENKRLEGKLLDLIRLVKYWGRISFGSWLPSYLLETLVINYGKNRISLNDYIDLRFIDFLTWVQGKIYGSIYDMKDIQNNINNLTFDQKSKFNNVVRQDLQNSNIAFEFERKQDHKQAIEYWAKVFGKRFPTFG